MSARTLASALTPTISNRNTALPSYKRCVDEDYFPDPNALSAYHVCLEFEQAARDANEPEKVVHARILGYLLLFSPSRKVLSEVAIVIHSCDNQGNRNENLDNLGESFLNWFIRLFKKHKCGTPPTTEYSSHQSFGDEIMRNLEETPKNHLQAKERARRRDGYRCIATGHYDRLAIDLGIATDDEIIAAGGIVRTHCAHIVPESTHFDGECQGNKTNTKKSYSASVLAVLERFGYDISKVNGPKAHSLFNVMTMEMNAHEGFDRLELWFEETNTPNVYRPKSVYAKYLILPEVVTFTSPDPERLPLPSSELLALHAACCKTAQMSGAAAYLDGLDREMDNLDVLAPDGTSSAALEHAIWGKLGNIIGTGA